MGRLISWTDTAEHLAGRRLISSAMVRRIRWLDVFGRLIASSDLQGGNLSFFVGGTRVLEVCPPYDMTPMHYAPRQSEVVDRPFVPPTPRPADAPVWRSAWAAASELWQGVASDTRVSPGFREIGAANVGSLAALEAVGAALPR